MQNKNLNERRNILAEEKKQKKKHAVSQVFMHRQNVNLHNDMYIQLKLIVADSNYTVWMDKLHSTEMYSNDISLKRQPLNQILHNLNT